VKDELPVGDSLSVIDMLKPNTGSRQEEVVWVRILFLGFLQKKIKHKKKS
jgi:hypothetical protein